MAPSAIDSGLARSGINLTRVEKTLYIDRNLITNDVTAKINTGLKALEERAAFTKDVSSIFKSELGDCSE